MTLDSWLTEKKLKSEEFAAMIGTTGEAVRRYRTGHRFPEPMIVESIVNATDGEVTVQDLHETRLAFLRQSQSDASPEAA